MANHNEELSQISISVEEKDKLVAEVIRYILFKTHQRHVCMYVCLRHIRREELSQIVTKNYRQRSLPALVINEARSKLSSIFGYEMKELQRPRASSVKQLRSSQQSVGDAKTYVLVSQISPDVYKTFVEDKKTSHINGFTFAVISIVQLAGGKISEENLWHHLTRLGLNQNDESHPVFGNVKNSLESLVQQRYLQKEKLSGVEGNSIMYELAERALDASMSDSVKEYIVKIANKDISPAAVELD